MERDQRKAAAIRSDWRTAPLAPRERAICEFAHRLAVDAHGAGAAWHTRLAAEGVDDEEMLHVVEIAAYFSFVNRLAEGLGVRLEPGKAQRGEP